MDISKNKIEVSLYQPCKVSELPDGSIRIVTYSEVVEPKEMLKLSKSWGGNYNLSLELPVQRDLEICVNIIKTSANCYKVMYSDKNESVYETFKTLAEVNKFLKDTRQLKIK